MPISLDLTTCWLFSPCTDLDITHCTKLLLSIRCTPCFYLGNLAGNVLIVVEYGFASDTSLAEDSIEAASPFILIYER
jgi:hypothetical protein